MDKISQFLEKYLGPVGVWMSENRILKSIAGGMIFVMPFLIVAAIFQIIEAIPKLFTFLPEWSESASNILLLPYNILFGIIALIVSFSVAYKHSEQLKINPSVGGVISLAVFLIIAAKYENNAFDATFFGYAGIFTAVIVALITVELYRFLLDRKIRVKLPDTVADMVQSSFEAFIPLFLILVVFYILSVLIQKWTGQMIPAIIQTAVAPALEASDSIWFWLPLGILMSIFFWMGMHGWVVMSSVWLAATMTFTSGNAEAAAAGLPLPYISGGTWQMTGQLHWHIPLMLMFFCKARRNKAIGRASLIPGIFAISEPYTFGTPVVFNPILGIPFVLAPAVSMIFNFLFIQWGWVDRSASLVLVLAPAPIQTFLGTNDWKVFLVFPILLAIQVAIWYPFLKVWDRACLREEQQEAAPQVAPEATTAGK